MASAQEGSVAGHYRLQRRGLIRLLGVAAALGAIGAVLLFLDGKPVNGAIGLAVSGTWLANVLMMRAQQTIVSPEGLRVINGLRWRTIPWGDVVGIDKPSRYSSDRAMRATTRDGRQVVLYIPVALREDLLAYADAHRQPAWPRSDGQGDGIP